MGHFCFSNCGSPVAESQAACGVAALSKRLPTVTLVARCLVFRLQTPFEFHGVLAVERAKSEQIWRALIWIKSVVCSLESELIFFVCDECL